ncbi:MAG TPA: helix-turn-helix domain-containing protein [Anaeromyxobacter sp.]|nr:helix-turn-helix domain-containing protein [Anaeromyxobacter sp.]
MGRPPNPDLHDALLESARVEFASRGLDRARVEDIARRAGASKGAFYLHFASKEVAFEEILQRFMGALEDQAGRREEEEAAFRREHGGLPEREYRERQVEFDCRVDLGLLETLWRNRQILPVIEGAGSSRYQRSVNEFRRRMHAFIAGRIAGKQALGWIRADVDPALIGDILVGTYEGFARRMGELAERPDLVRWLRSFTLVLYEGILERPAQVPAPSPPARPPPLPSARSGASPRRRDGGTRLTNGS